MTSWIRLHLLSEVRTGEGWVSQESWDVRGPFLNLANPMYRTRRGSEAPALLYMLGLPGDVPYLPEVMPFETFPLDLDTVDARTATYVQQQDPSTFHCVDLPQVLKYPWNVGIVRRTTLTPEAYVHWKHTGVVPRLPEGTPEELRTKELTYTLDAHELWSPEWLQHSLPFLKTLDPDNTRLICLFTEESHG